jgi:signal transduction histidine kinase
MPALFMGAALVQARDGRAGVLPFLPLLVALLLVPLMGGSPLASPLTPVWHAVGWGTPAIIYSRTRRLRQEHGGRQLNLALTVMVPIGVVGAILLGGVFLRYLLPLMTIVIQLLIFTGVVYHRYYDIEVRAARSGELAAGAAQRDRLALLGELAATIAHEVRNPLTGIRSLTQRIAEGPLEEAKRSRYAEVILGEIARLDRIVGNLSDLARRNGATNAEAGLTELRPLFEDLSLLLEARARRAGVRLVVLPLEPTAPSAREPLAQALLNLLINAVAHSPAGGTIELGSSRQRDRVTIHVRDQGPGVPPAERERIFEAFHTGSGGTGLGLTVVRRVAQEQDWTVEVVDAPGHGAEFRIHITDRPTV